MKNPAVMEDDLRDLGWISLGYFFPGIFTYTINLNEGIPYARSMDLHANIDPKSGVVSFEPYRYNTKKKYTREDVILMFGRAKQFMEVALKYGYKEVCFNEYIIRTHR